MHGLFNPMMTDICEKTNHQKQEIYKSLINKRDLSYIEKMQLAILINSSHGRTCN